MFAIQNDRQVAALALSILSVVLVTISVCLRVVAKIVKRNPLARDDYCIFAATFQVAEIIPYRFYSGKDPTLFMLLVESRIIADWFVKGVRKGGIGLHITKVLIEGGIEALVVVLKNMVADQMLWAMSLMFTKLSILFFYMTIFSTPNFKICAYAIMGIVVIWGLAVICCGFFLCRPFAYNWDLTIPDGKCGDLVTSYIATGSVNMATDIMVLTLPMPMVWNLHAPRSDKMVLTAIFAFGFFICIISMLRIKAVFGVSLTDITYSIVDSMIWSILEPGFGIVLACLPVIRPLFMQLFSKVPRKNKSDSGSSGSDNTGLSVGSGPPNKHFQLIEEHDYPLGALRPDQVKTAQRVYSTQQRDESASQISERSPMAAHGIKVDLDWEISHETVRVSPDM
ncbi:hypothetical protein BP6252_13391 [Coleophoma cylindrospora]|uniref:Rhodopsin domain-containing protein n=1 Tax=Coleophoma cylindrospora TaxID=1849047 RepID=A0A3D8Q8I3_9HELO|nr:hypothetical protein BP6252_13391 [Coleophoma cylindrospora]